MTQQLNYDATQAGIQMTLSSIAYVDESQSPEQIKVAIETELAKTKYATRGNWELAWGPGNIDGNLMYVAKNKVNTNQYSLVIRGTDWDYISNLKEDFWLQPVKYPYASSASGTPMVSHGVLEGLQKLQQLTDPLTSQTLEEYLKSLAANSSLDLIVTGHSLGGGLASIALIWLYDTIPGWGIDSGKIKLSAYTFAAPTAGNQDFATYFNVTVGNNCFRIVNPLDIVPNAWGDLSLILQEQIPTTLPYYVDFIIAGVIAYLDVKCWFYKQVNTEKMLRKVQIPPSVTYLTQVADQHNSNSYLYLLGAPQTDIGTLSPLSNYDKKDVLAVEDTRLSPPQYILYNKIVSSIGADPTVHIKNIYQKSGVYYIDIYTEDAKKATGLMGVLIDRYDFGGIKVQICVFAPNGERTATNQSADNIEPISATRALIENALIGNPYFVTIKEVPQSPFFPPTLGQLAIVFAKQVIQYPSDNISDYYGNSNEVAQNVFQEIMKDNYYSTVRVSFTTEFASVSLGRVCQS